MLTAWAREFARLVHEQRDTLTQLDAAIGDADHGANLDRGMTAVVAALETQSPEDPAAVLRSALRDAHPATSPAAVGAPRSAISLAASR